MFQQRLAQAVVPRCHRQPITETNRLLTRLVPGGLAMARTVKPAVERGAALILSKSYVGVAGWTIPAPMAERFERTGSHLERYASRFNAVEINSSFYRPHRCSTYERWAASVPDDFRFAVKLPKAITHERRLRGCRDLLERFAGETAGLGEKRGPILVQLPPSLPFKYAAAREFITEARQILGGAIVCEPRHASWFSKEADALLAGEHIARVAADPPMAKGGSQPGGWRGQAYFRLHGTPRIYWSDYADATIRRYAQLIRDILQTGREVWTIFDNTAAERAPANALTLLHELA